MPSVVAPSFIAGMCHLCGYAVHPSGCAQHPCHRCFHQVSQRNDSTRGYDIDDYLACPCPCHAKWREAYNVALESGAALRYVPAEPPRGRHQPQEADWL